MNKNQFIIYKMLLRKTQRFLFSATRLSHLKGDTSRPISENNISQTLQASSQIYANNLALISDFQDIQLTYSQLFELSRRAAANMIDLGIEPGTKMGMYSPNNAEWMLCQYACSLADVHMVNINPAYKPNELMHGLSLAEVETLIVPDSTVPARIMDNVEWFMLREQVKVFDNNNTGIANVIIIIRVEGI
jgi:fatty-acyl-CoA synthase